MLLVRTEKARAELSPGSRSLGLRERSVLLLASGRKPARELHALFDGAGEQIVLKLMGEGFLVPVAGEPDIPIPLEAPASPPVAHEAPDGRRSLATTRMFLFDLVERMFVRRDPALATILRTELREARDRATMLAVAEDMLVEIDRAAGPERAEAVRVRIAAMLPLQET